MPSLCQKIDLIFSSFYKLSILYHGPTPFTYPARSAYSSERPEAAFHIPTSLLLPQTSILNPPSAVGHASNLCRSPFSYALLSGLCFNFPPSALPIPTSLLLIRVAPASNVPFYSPKTEDLKDVPFYPPKLSYLRLSVSA